MQTWRQPTETITTDYLNFTQEGLMASPVVGALVDTRMRLFSDIDFRWRDRTTREWLDDTADLMLLRTPWPGGTTADLLAYMELDLSLAGNAYVHRTTEGTLQRLRPDWVSVVANPARTRKGGYLYHEDGLFTDSIPLTIEEVAHYTDRPHPLKAFIGQSWMVACARDINADVAASKFINAFFTNAATPNMVIRTMSELSEDQRVRLRDMLNQEYTGDINAFKTLVLEGSSEVDVVGRDLRQLEFSQSRAAGETRIAAAAGVAPIVAGLREGLQAGTYSNYGQAVRKTIDWLLRPLWRNVSQSLQVILNPPTPNAELWYDSSRVEALQQDALDAAQIKSTNAGTINTLITAGYEPNDVPEAVATGDFSDLAHTGLFSVQLQPPGTTAEPEPAPAPTPEEEEVPA